MHSRVLCLRVSHEVVVRCWLKLQSFQGLTGVGSTSKLTWVLAGCSSSQALKANMVKPHFYKKYKNLSGMVSRACSPSYSEAEAGGSLEPRRLRQQ